MSETGAAWVGKLRSPAATVPEPTASELRDFGREPAIRRGVMLARSLVPQNWPTSKPTANTLRVPSNRDLFPIGTPINYVTDVRRSCASNLA